VIDRGELQARADAFAWYHSIDLGDGVVTKGLSDPATRLDEQQLPDFTGRTVLDVGAWDGYYSFLAERSGAARVVALDHYAWGVDIAAREGYWEECRNNGTLPDQSRDTTDFWRPDLPGKRGFDLAHEVLESKVETVVADFTTVDLDTVGSFDVVLYLGVLYHMKEPLTCLERVRAVTREVAVIETAAAHFPQAPGEVLLRFHAGSELNRDFGNWYQPSIEALVALARAAGFRRVEVVQGPPPVPLPPRPTSLRDRIRPPVPPPPSTQEYRAIVHAFV
jgi:tRNA (mo5U34)-methyltransferase